jgi:hypothetical protein
MSHPLQANTKAEANLTLQDNDFYLNAGAGIVKKSKNKIRTSRTSRMSRKSSIGSGSLH